MGGVVVELMHWRRSDAFCDSFMTLKTCVLPHVSEPFNHIRWTTGWLVTSDLLATLSDRKFAVSVIRDDGRNQSSLQDASESDGTSAATSSLESNHKFGS